MRVEVRNRCSDFDSYRAARVKSLFNVESGADFHLDADLDLPESWRIGVVVGPSGSGKTSIGRQLFGEPAFYAPEWPADAPIVDAIAPHGDFNEVTAALGSVGLGSVPAWLRPYHALSNGEKFRADLARLAAESPSRAVVDEFTSVVDRQIARIGAMAFAKAWRRAPGGQVVLLTPHYDVVDWIEPDWVYDTAKRAFARGSLRRPRLALEIRKTNGSYWPLFEPHHYLKLPRMIGAAYYVGTVDGELAAHVGVSTAWAGAGVEARACRLVVMPEWQGAGVGARFLDFIAELQLTGGEGARLPGRPLHTLFHTSRPQLAAALRRNGRWRQISASLAGGNGEKARNSLRKSLAAKGSSLKNAAYGVGKFGGHLRAVQGFRYYGAAGLQALAA